MNPTHPGATSAPKPRPIALTIAGSDSGGGAGIQADLRTFAAFGVHGTSVITALTAQNTRGVGAIRMTPGAMIAAQIDAVLGDFPVAAIKLGMLGSATVARRIAASLAPRASIPLVLDPVLVATSGAALARGQLVEAMRRHLLPRADLITPNLPEAERLLDRRVRTRADMPAAARDLRQLGCRSVLLKGGHLRGAQVHDLLFDDDGEHWFNNPRIDAEGHGTGCTLSAAIAAGLARGKAMHEAIADAVAFVHRGLERGYRPGRGKLVVLDHLAAAKPA